MTIQNPFQAQLNRLTQKLLSSEECPSTLRPEVIKISEIFQELCSDTFTKKERLDEGESFTAHGLAVSPTLAAACVDDYMRTIFYLRGLFAAIHDQSSKISNRPVRILYAGCGPFATLAVPLMSVLEAREAQFTFLDIHRESIESARTLVDALEFNNFVHEYLTGDAMFYEVSCSEPPDIIVMETMQAALGKEMQVPMTRWLMGQAPDAILVPQEIQIELTLLDPGREFDIEQQGITRKRTKPLEVFSINKEKVIEWQKLHHTLPGSKITIPAAAPQMQGMLFTNIQVYGEHKLKDYHCGLTSPILWPEPIVEGQEWQFNYRLEKSPYLAWEKLPPSSSGEKALSPSEE